MSPAFIIGSIIGLIAYSNRKNVLSNEEVKAPFFGNDSKTATSDDLIIETNFQVDGFEKLFESKEDIAKKIKAAAIKLKTIECTHMPHLIGDEYTLIVKDSNIGYRVTLKWPARWVSTRPGNVREIVRTCILNSVLSKLPSKARKRIKEFKVYRV